MSATMYMMMFRDDVGGNDVGDNDVNEENDVGDDVCVDVDEVSEDIFYHFLSNQNNTYCTNHSYKNWTYSS